MSPSSSGKTAPGRRYRDVAATDELTRSELRAIRGRYRRRVYIAFLIPALIAGALGWLLFQDQDTNSGAPSQAAPRTTVSGPITREVVSENCVVAPQGSQHHAGPRRPGTQGRRLHAKALTDYQEGKIGLAGARRRWDATTKVGLAGADRFEKQAAAYKMAATCCDKAATPTLDRLDQLACRNADGFSSALTQETPPILSFAPLGAVLFPQQPAPATAPTSPPREVMPLPPIEGSGRRAWCCSVLVDASGPRAPGRTYRPYRLTRSMPAVGGASRRRPGAWWFR